MNDSYKIQFNTILKFIIIVKVKYRKKKNFYKKNLNLFEL